MTPSDAFLLDTIRRGELTPRARFFVDLLRYGAASAAALVVDAGILLLLFSFLGVNYLVAASIGFLSGLGVVYVLSVRYVYDDARVLRPAQESAGFLVTGLIGLLLTQASMAILVSAGGLPVGGAKIATVALAFLFNFLSRRTLLFSSVSERGPRVSSWQGQARP